MSFIESFPNDRQNQLYLIYLFVFMRSLEFTVYQAEIFNLFRRVDRAIYDTKLMTSRTRIAILW